MGNVTTQPKCVLCDRPAITTAAQSPVCAEHDRAYADEAKRDLPLHQRPVYLALLSTSPVIPHHPDVETIIGFSP